MLQMSKAYKMLIREPSAKRYVERISKTNIKMNVGELSCGSVKWNELD
jgi:hypothetical protein